MKVRLYPAPTPTGHVWLVSTRSASGEQTPYRPIVKDDKPTAQAIAREVARELRDDKPHTGKWMTTAQVAQHFGVSVDTVERRRALAEALGVTDTPWTKSGRTVRWLATRIDDFWKRSSTWRASGNAAASTTSNGDRSSRATPARRWWYGRAVDAHGLIWERANALVAQDVDWLVREMRDRVIARLRAASNREPSRFLEMLSGEMTEQQAIDAYK